MAELVDAGDSNSPDKCRTGSNPVVRTGSHSLIGRATDCGSVRSNSLYGFKSH